MRHGCKVNHLSRKAAHRSSMLSNMASSLIKHKRIETTLAKAKALRKYVEPLINKSKEDSTHQRRIVFAHLRDKEAVTELFREVSQKIANRNGGYTRILKLGRRWGDGAEMAMMELVDYNENMMKDTVVKKAKSTRRGGKKKATQSTSDSVTTTETTQTEQSEAQTPIAE
ncbi:MAG: 50S ribosomal protein L17 [Bacteroidota bacterium]|nr:50S ribosomal protein L17 [Bacteroidota bacterium]